MKAIPTFIAAAGLALLAGCATAPTPLCTWVVKDHGVSKAPKTPEDWFSLLLHGYDASTGAPPRPTLDCMGAPVFWMEPEADECSEPGPRAQLLPHPSKLTAADLIMELVQGEKLRLVWVITRRLANGEALGPVGLVEKVDDRTYVVRALGALRAPPEKVTFELKRSGATDLLVVEGNSCADESSDSCYRSTRVLPLRLTRFFPEPIMSQDGQCLGPAWFPHRRVEVFALSSGLHRQVVLTSALKIEADALHIQERVVVSDLDPRKRDLPPRPHSTSQRERTIRVERSGLIGSAQSLWAQTMKDQLNEGAKPVKEAPPAPKRPETKAAARF